MARRKWQEGLADAAIRAGRPLTAVLYSRVSDDVHGDQRSVEEQDEGNLDACATNGWVVGAAYSDNDKSASRFAANAKGREEWDLLLEELEAGRYEMLVLWEASRGDRTLARWIALLDTCRTLGILIHVTNDDHTYDVRKRRDYRTLAEEGLNSSDESEKTSERVRREKGSAARKGRPHGRHLYGYRRAYGIDERGRRKLVKIEFDEESREATGSDGAVTTYTHAGVVREIMRRVASGDTCRAIARDLNARGIQSPRNGARGWQDLRVKEIALNPAYAGRRVHQGEVIPGVVAVWPRLVEVKTHRAIMARYADSSRTVRNDNAVKYLLTWVAVCGVCGNMVRRIGSGTEPRYVCNPGGSGSGYCVSRRIADVDDYVERSIWLRLAREDIAELLAEDDRADERLVKLEAEIDEMQERVDAARASFKAGRMSIESFEDIEADLRPQIKRAGQRLQASRVAPVLRGLLLPTVEEIEAVWRRRSIPQRREVVRVLTDKIVILPLGARKRYPPEKSVKIVWRDSTESEPKR